MARKVVTILLSATTIVFTALSVERSPLAQSNAMTPWSILSVTPFEDPLVDITAYNPAFHSIFSGLLSRSEFSHLAKIAVVVTNRSSAAVDGLLVQWDVPKRVGGTKTHSVAIDRYNRPQRHILEPGAQALITPTGYITEDQIGTNLVTSALAPQEAVRAFHVATTIPVSVDSVIWDDGGVTGPDRFKIIDYINARHAVARSLVQRLQTQSPTDDAAFNRLLKTLQSEAARNTAMNRHLSHWTNVLAMTARHTPNEVTRLAGVILPRLFPR